ncbi:MAG: hypothetical protein GY934_11110 [Gammaproteobacteria bacterium]|nr:hypothetical protein [Gammaproteobacteria bacterium]
MIQIGSFTIQYERTARAWTVRNGRFMKPFQTGTVGKRQAIQFAIHEAYPAVAQAVSHVCEQNTHASGRAWAAAQLLVTGHVLKPAADDASACVARVLSQQAGKPARWYRLTRTEIGLTCDCHDFMQGGVVVAEQLLCKHLLAFRLANHLSWKVAAAPPVPRQPKRVSGGQWRGRVATRVGVPYPVPAPSDAPPTFQSGEPVDTSHYTAYRAYVDVIGQRPFNAEKLISWTIGR